MIPRPRSLSSLIVDADIGKEKENVGESVITLQRGERENLQMKDDVVVMWQDPKFTFSWEFHPIMRTSTRLFEL